jgi:DNA-binding PadR family transcriptional regulator
MQQPQDEISGNLQAKIMMLLREEQLCGVDLMKRLRLKSPGTIYPVLETLRTKGLVDYKVEMNGAIRKKIYFLTELGTQKTRNHLISSIKFCCDTSNYVNKILKNVQELIKIERHEKVLSTLDHEELKRFLKGADATYSSSLEIPAGAFDTALSFIGVGCLIGNDPSDISEYVNKLYTCLRKGGHLLAIETEKSDNMFSQILFEDVFGLSGPPGLGREELERILQKAGFREISVISKMGLLYATAQKP